MKFSTIFLAGLTTADDTDDTAIEKLERLDNLTTDIIHSDSNRKPESWKDKMWDRVGRNVDRLVASYEKCGTKYSSNLEFDSMVDSIEFDSSNPCGTVNEVMNGYSAWVERYISSCGGQRKHSHQKKRMVKWRAAFNKGNGFNFKMIRS